MKKFILLLLVLVANFAKASTNETPTFSFTVQQFKENYNTQAIIDKGSLINSIMHKQGSYFLKIDTKKFNESVQAFKKLDLINGNFTLKTTILLDTAKDGKVRLIIVKGDRADPANMFNLIRVMGTIIKTLNPNTSEDENAQFFQSLGLMRGDDDPTIGQPIMQLDQAGQFNCNNQLSNTTTEFGCAITPRF